MFMKTNRINCFKLFLILVFIVYVGPSLLAQILKHLKSKSNGTSRSNLAKAICKTSREKRVEKEISSEKSSKQKIDIDIVYQSSDLNEQYAKYISKEASALKPYKKYANKTVIKKERRFFLILEYTQVFWQTKFCDLSVNTYSYKDDSVFQKVMSQKKLPQVYDVLDRCAFRNCFFTCDKALLNESDALVFHDADLKNDMLNQVKNLESESEIGDFMRKYIHFARDPNQIWIFWSDEPNTIMQQVDRFRFNWTLTYNSMSEVSYGTYGAFSTKIRDSTNQKSEQEFDEFVRKQFDSRKSSSVWFVSNCKPKFRMHFAIQLSNYYSLSVYGKCYSSINEIKTGKKYLNNVFDSCPSGISCEQNALKSNKFYLAFESQNCTDYVTEKFWRSLDHDLIPIVVQPNKNVYERIAPRNSFIHAADFNYDAEKLAQYLAKVASDFRLYSSYFEWKKHHRVFYTAKDLESLRICELCYKLNTKKYEKLNSYYPSVSTWLNSQCSNE